MIRDKTMIKVGDKAKGFRFDDSTGVRYNNEMEKMVGKTGTVISIGTTNFTPSIIIEFEELREEISYWNYPLQEYLAILREERLKELGL